MRIKYGVERLLGWEVMDRLYAYRYAVFVERLKWKLPDARPGREMDQFDRSDTIHVVGQDAAGVICGCARLLPTTRPYLLGSIFPELMAGQDVPYARDIWEISRFSSIDLSGGAREQADFWGCREVMAATVSCAMELGARRLIGVSVLSIERILCRLGVNAYRAGPAMRLHGHNVFAFWLDIDDRTLNALGLEMVMASPVTNDRFRNPKSLSYSNLHVA